MKRRRLKGATAALCIAIVAPQAVVAQSPVLARGLYASFTADAASAYVEAALFCHRQFAIPVNIASSEAQYRSIIVEYFPKSSQYEQVNLSNARGIWEAHYSAWNWKTPEEKRDFCYEVLAVTYGSPLAYTAIYPEASQGGGRSSQPAGGELSPTFDDDGILNDANGDFIGSVGIIPMD